jgi:hypothetical protein
MHAQAWALCQMSDVLASILNMYLSVKYQPPEEMHAHGTQSININEMGPNIKRKQGYTNK